MRKGFISPLMLLPLAAMALSADVPATQPRLQHKAGARNLPVSDILDVDIVTTETQQANYRDFERKCRESRARGDTMWGSDTWMKSPDYYQKLDTPALAIECFSRSIFGWEMGIFDDPQYGIIRLRIMHNGFAELFGRRDLVAALSPLYRDLAAKIKPDADDRTIVTTSLILDNLHYVYLLPEVQSQVKGHEADLLAAHLDVLRAYRHYITAYDARGTPAPLLFYGEAATVADVSLSFLKKTDPAADAIIRPKLHAFRWPQPQTAENQKLKDVGAYIDLVLTNVPATRPQ